MKKQPKKGRDKGLIKLRDELLIRRYFELYEIKRLRFDDILTILSQDEFFISEQRISLIIRKNTDLIYKLSKQKLTKAKSHESE